MRVLESAGLEKWYTLYQRVARGNRGELLAGRRLHMCARPAGFQEGVVLRDAHARG